MTREETIEFGKFWLDLNKDGKGSRTYEFFELAIKALEKEPCEDMGEASDGHHTFNQLYHQRAILFATIVNEYPDISWKSFKHSDGHYCFDEGGEMFIVGIDTPEGSYTYHYHKKYWDLFKCKELECGKEWDGHTEKDVTRLLSLPPVQPKSPWIRIEFKGDALNCPLPDDGERVLLRFKNGYVTTDTCQVTIDEEDNTCYGFEDNPDFEDIDAWMKIPE